MGDKATSMGLPRVTAGWRGEAQHRVDHLILDGEDAEAEHDAPPNHTAGNVSAQCAINGG